MWVLFKHTSHKRSWKWQTPTAQLDGREWWKEAEPAPVDRGYVQGGVGQEGCFWTKGNALQLLSGGFSGTRLPVHRYVELSSRQVGFLLPVSYASKDTRIMHISKLKEDQKILYLHLKRAAGLGVLEVLSGLLRQQGLQSWSDLEEWPTSRRVRPQDWEGPMCRSGHTGDSTREGRCRPDPKASQTLAESVVHGDDIPGSISELPSTNGTGHLPTALWHSQNSVIHNDTLRRLRTRSCFIFLNNSQVPWFLSTPKRG